LPARSPAERLDEALDRLLSDQHPGADTELMPLVRTASRLREALPLVPTGHAFESRLGARLTHPGRITSAVAAIGEMTRRELRHPSRLLVTGAVSSAAVGVSITALVVWRGTHRHAADR
jgi:hypothetical protein